MPIIRKSGCGWTRNRKFAFKAYMQCNDQWGDQDSGQMVRTNKPALIALLGLHSRCMMYVMRRRISARLRVHSCSPWSLRCQVRARLVRLEEQWNRRDPSSMTTILNWRTDTLRIHKSSLINFIQFQAVSAFSIKWHKKPKIIIMD